MVAIVQRTRILQQLLSVRTGKGSARLGSNVSRIHLDIGESRVQGNMGARQFWKEYLPRLRYHNPEIPISVTRRADSPGELTIEFGSPSSSSPTPSSTSTTPSNSTKIKVLSRDRDSILQDLYKATSAQVLQPSQEDVRMQQELNEELYAINELRKKNAVILAEIKREQAMMKAAMSGVEVEKKPTGRRRPTS